MELIDRLHHENGLTVPGGQPLLNVLVPHVCRSSPSWALGDFPPLLPLREAITEEHPPNRFTGYRRHRRKWMVSASESAYGGDRGVDASAPIQETFAAGFMQRGAAG